MISTELSIVLGKQFHFLWCSILTLPEHYEKNGGSGKTGHCEGRAPLKKVYPSFFYPLRPFKLKKHEWLVNSKISREPYYRAWTIKVNKSRYIALFMVSGSIKKFSSIYCVNIYFSQSIFNYRFSIFFQ